MYVALLFKVKDGVSVYSTPGGSDLSIVASTVLTVRAVQLWDRGLPHFGTPYCSGEALYPNSNQFLKRGSGMGSQIIWTELAVKYSPCGNCFKEDCFPICHGKMQEHFLNDHAFLRVDWGSERGRKDAFFETFQTMSKAEVRLGSWAGDITYRCFALKSDMSCLISHGLLSCVLKHSPNCFGSPATKIH